MNTLTGHNKKGIPYFLKWIVLPLLIIALLMIWYLTSQNPVDTVDLSSKVQSVPFVGTFLNWMGAYVDWSIRQWAHVFEFFIVGLFTMCCCKLLMKKKYLAPILALVCCAIFSVADQTHRLFVPGRHFDGFDLVLDALGYGSGILLVLLFGWIGRKAGNRYRRETKK